MTTRASTITRANVNPGARPFDDQHSDYFFGRERDIDRIIDRIRAQRLSVLEAASACGKTSLLQAGLVPALRRARLEAFSADSSTLPQFPLLLNQWTARAGRGTGYVRLLLGEAVRYLDECRTWYERHADAPGAAENRPVGRSIDRELENITSAVDALKSVAKNFDSDDARGVESESAAGTAGANPAAVARARLSDQLIAVIEPLRNVFGSVLLILDQFEEVLGDAVLGDEALSAVEIVFEQYRSDVRQFLSLRSDSTYLLRPLVDIRILERMRTVTVDPLSAGAVLEIQRKMAGRAGLEWKDAEYGAANRDRLTPIAKRLGFAWSEENVGEAHLIELIGAFTKAGGTRADVNLLGLNVVVRAIFGLPDVQDQNTGKVTSAHICKYCTRLNGGKEVSRHELETWLCCKRGPRGECNARPPAEEAPRDCCKRGPKGECNARLLAEEAPRDWIERYLAGEEGAGARVRVSLESCIRPMAARMANWLVTPAGFKRPMTKKELHEVAFGADLEKNPQLARQNTERWNNEQYKKELAQLREKMAETCDKTLDRLVDGNVLKKRGSSGDDVSYELVHDQFGAPLQRWAEAFRATPAADLGSPYAISDKEFGWGGRLADFIDDEARGRGRGAGAQPRKIARAIVWLGCTLREVDFSGLTFEGCDFSRSLFQGCTFRNATLKNCSFDRAAFEGCTFSDCTFEFCSLDSIAVRDWKRKDNTGQPNEFTDVTFSGGTVRYAEVREVREVRGMRYAEVRGAKLTRCAFKGASRDDRLDMMNFILAKCDLNGVTFTHCALAGASLDAVGDLKSKSQAQGSLSFNDCDLKGMVVDHSQFSRDNFSITGGQANGTVFIQATLPGARFERVNLTGAIFKGCELQGARFKGVKRPKNADSDEQLARALEFCPDDTEKKPCDLSDASFEDLQLENFSIAGCTPGGRMRFAGCCLSGGTIAGNPDSRKPKLDPVDVDMQFEDCDMRGIKMRDLRFSEGRLSMRRGSAHGAVFSRIRLDPPDGGAPCGLFENVALASAVFLGCKLSNTRFVGVSGKWIEADSLMFRDDPKTGIRSVLKNVTFEHLSLKSLGVRACEICGPVTFTRCRLPGATFDKLDQVRGDLTFEKCDDMAAVEFASLDLSDAHLSITKSDAPGICFRNVTLSCKDHKTGFVRTNMDGAVFLGCRIHGVQFKGTRRKPASLGAIVFRNLSDVDAVMGDCAFEDATLPNCIFRNLKIDGPLAFTRCKLAGGSLCGDEPVSKRRSDRAKTGKVEKTRKVELGAALNFQDCMLTGFEVANARLSPAGRIELDAGCDCRGALFRWLTIRGSTTRRPRIRIQAKDLSGFVLRDSKLDGVHLVAPTEGKPTPALGLVIRECTVADVRVRRYDCAGGSFEDIELAGPITFDACGLRRTKFVKIRPAGRLAINRSDLANSEIDSELDARRTDAGRPGPAHSRRGRRRATAASAKGAQGGAGGVKPRRRRGSAVH